MLNTFKKLLLKVIQDKPESDFIQAFSDFVFNQLTPNTLDRIKNKYNILLNTKEDIQELLWTLGHDFTSGDNWLNTDDYNKKEFSTISQRILNKTTRVGYLHEFHNFFLNNVVIYKGNCIEGESIVNLPYTVDIDVGAKVFSRCTAPETYVVSKNTTSIRITNPFIATKFENTFYFQNEGSYPLLLGNSPTSSIEILAINDLLSSLFVSPNFLDETVPLILDGDPFLDSTSTGILWRLDNASIQSLTTRQFLLSFAYDREEIPGSFMTAQTMQGLYNDVKQLKRKIEVPHFEPRLILRTPKGSIPPNPTNMVSLLSMVTGEEITTTSISISETIAATGASGTNSSIRTNQYAKIVSALYKSKLSDVKKIQFGTGGRSSFAKADVYASVATNGLAVDVPFEADFSYFPPTNAHLKFVDPQNYPNGYIQLQNELPVAYAFDISYFKTELITDDRLIFRNYLFPYHKWSQFSELALFDSLNECVYYAAFPRVEYYSEMLSSIYVDIEIKKFMAEFADTKYTLNFLTTDWSPSGSNYIINIFMDVHNTVTTFPTPSHSQGYNPFYVVLQDIGGGIYQQVLEPDIKINSVGDVLLVVPNIGSTFKGKILII